MAAKRSDMQRRTAPSAGQVLSPSLDPSQEALVPGWIGTPVYDVAGARIGHVADVLFAADRAPGWVLLDLRPALARTVLAPARGLRHRVLGVQLACECEQVRTAPTPVTPPDGLTRDHALPLAAHYRVRCGAGPWWGVATPHVAATPDAG